MTDEDRARRVLPPCSCEGGFKERGLVAPDCVWCNWGEDVADALAAVRADERERWARWHDEQEAANSADPGGDAMTPRVSDSWCREVIRAGKVPDLNLVPAPDVCADLLEARAALAAVTAERDALRAIREKAIEDIRDDITRQVIAAHNRAVVAANPDRADWTILVPLEPRALTSGDATHE